MTILIIILRPRMSFPLMKLAGMFHCSMSTDWADRLTVRPMHQAKMESLYIRFLHTTAREECVGNGCLRFLTKRAKSCRSRTLQTFRGTLTMTVWHTVTLRTMPWTGTFMNPLPVHCGKTRAKAWNT